MTWLACVGTGELAGSGVEFRCECWEALWGKKKVLVGAGEERRCGEVDGENWGRDGGMEKYA